MPMKSLKPPQANTFNLARSPLEGFNLIDASAGTGKTYTICALVLRLLLEKCLGIEQILVVTYTEAATEDLRDRIRQKLRQALQALVNRKSEDPFLQEYLLLIADANEAKQRFADALRSFDGAAIFTIHSFCQRILLENSFESNSLFDTELVADDSYLLREIVEDFWRINFCQESDLFVQHVADRISPDVLHDFLSTFLPHPMLEFLPAFEPEDYCCNLSSIEQEYVAAYRSVCMAWQTARDEVTRDLYDSKALNRNTYRTGKIQSLLTGMETMAAACHPSPVLFDGFTLLTSSTIISRTKTNHTPNILLFYDLCEKLQLAQSVLLHQYDLCLLAKKKKLADTFRNEFNKRKERKNIFSFDDLLRKLHRALSGPGGASFARTVAGKYPAVLIDEFQDTDPLQLEIFTTICREHSLLFLIGDPKQAIYSFRGADIFTYMDTVFSSQLIRHTLDVNHRSIPSLVQAVNTIFSSATRPFIFDAIAFEPASTTRKEGQEFLTIDGRHEPPFIVWHVDKEGTAGTTQKLTKATARQTIIAAVAVEVTNLLALAAENRARLEGRKLMPGDIAILVRKNDEARKMQEALTACRVPSVLHSGDNLFTSREAREMALLLGGITAPRHLPRVKTGLLTRLIGLGAAEIDPGSPNSESVIEKWLLRFRAYHEIWNHHGFIQLFWTIMAENQVRVRLLAEENGERSLTNILHLAEILHQEAVERGLNMTALLDYLHDRIAGEKGQNVEHQLRLESDADRVKIVTIHKSKGLEYPVVFCPFTWEGTRLSSAKSCLFHLHKKTDTKTKLIFDAGSSDLEKHLLLARQEELAENLRLLYVALTRAVHRCYLAWGPFKDAETSAPAYLLHQGDAEAALPTASNLITFVTQRYRSLTGAEIRADLDDLAGASCNTISIRPCPEITAVDLLQKEEAFIPLRSREFTGTIATDWRISSFSSLIADRSVPAGIFPVAQEIIPGRDDFSPEQIVQEETERPAKKTHDIFSFPHGAGAGTMLHELLEKIDFSARAGETWENLVHQKLEQYGHDRAWGPALLQMLAHLANVSLLHKIPELQLSNIPASNCMHELEFYFPLARITPADMNSIFSIKTSPCPSPGVGKFISQQMDRLTFSPVKGFMKGFIDLVFMFGEKYYLVDWKSNYLGPAAIDYHKDRLLDAMIPGFYFLQYHLYCLALHLYLGKRLSGYDYDTHFGGVFYIFLRGVDHRLGPDYGIFHELPALSMINVLTENLVAGALKH
jgi:exodeoxyribonuclease V beta subunit